MIKEKTYYWTERWNPETQKWNRFSCYDNIEKAKELAEWWAKVCNGNSRVIEVKEKMVARFISKVENKQIP